jgi:ABC-type glycerol-3-phosphate transport system substrate-binding protein
VPQVPICADEPVRVESSETDCAMLTVRRWQLRNRAFGTRIGRWVLIVALLLVLCGCGEGKTVTPESVLPTSPPSPLLPTSTPVPTPEPQPMIVTLDLWLPKELDPYGSQAGADTLARQLDEFSNAYPDVQVEVTVKMAHGRGGLLDFLRTARDAAPSVMPDLIVLDATELETTVGLGLIQPLDGHLSPDVLAERFPFAAELGTVDGQIVGFVIGADMQHLAYRPSLLDSPPISWRQDFFPPVSFLFPAGGRGRTVDDATLIQYLAAGGGLTDAEGNPSLDEDVLESVLSFYDDCANFAAISRTISLAPPAILPTIASTASLTSTVAVSATAPLTASLAISPTATPTSALSVSPTIPLTSPPPATPVPALPVVSMTISPTVILVIMDADQAWRRFQDGEGDVSVTWAGSYWLEADQTFAPAPIPTYDGSPFSVTRREWAMALVADDPDRQALTMLLFNWLVAPDRNGEWTRAAGYLPGLRTALRQWDVSSTDRAILRDILDAAVPAPPSEVMAVVGLPMQEALGAVLRGYATPGEAAASAVDSLQQ